MESSILSCSTNNASALRRALVLTRLADWARYLDEVPNRFVAQWEEAGASNTSCCWFDSSQSDQHNMEGDLGLGLSTDLNLVGASRLGERNLHLPPNHPPTSRIGLGLLPRRGAFESF